MTIETSFEVDSDGENLIFQVLLSNKTYQVQFVLWFNGTYFYWWKLLVTWKDVRFDDMIFDEQ